MVKIILMVCFIPLLPILYAVLRNEAKFKKNIALGVTLPYVARTDPYVLHLCNRYRKRLTVLCAVLFVMQVPFYFIPSTAVYILVYLLWIIAVIVLPYLPFVHYHRLLKAYKETAGWSHVPRDAVVVDLKVAAQDRRSLSPWWFFPPVAVSIVPVVIEFASGTADSWAFVLAYIFLTLMVGLFYLFYRLINRQRGDVVEENAVLNETLTRIRRNNWSRMWLCMAWLTGGFNLCLWLLMANPIGLMTMIIVYIALCLLVALQTEFSARKAQHQLTVESGRGSYVDDDQYWPLGLFYYNPNDKHIMVNKRTGIGTTINLGRPAGKVLMTITALAITMLPLSGVWLMFEETAPLAIQITGDEVVATHTGAYHVSLHDIESVALWDSLPTGTTRLAGTGMENLAKGSYRVPGIGRCELSLDPKVGPYLLVCTQKITYLFGSRNPDETMAAYEEILVGIVDTRDTVCD